MGDDLILLLDDWRCGYLSPNRAGLKPVLLALSQTWYGRV